MDMLLVEAAAAGDKEAMAVAADQLMEEGYWEERLMLLTRHFNLERLARTVGTQIDNAVKEADRIGCVGGQAAVDMEWGAQPNPSVMLGHLAEAIFFMQLVQHRFEYVRHVEVRVREPRVRAVCRSGYPEHDRVLFGHFEWDGRNKRPFKTRMSFYGPGQMKIWSNWPETRAFYTTPGPLVVTSIYISKRMIREAQGDFLKPSQVRSVFTNLLNPRGRLFEAYPEGFFPGYEEATDVERGIPRASSPEFHIYRVKRPDEPW